MRGRSLEPILVPKLWIHLADFPYSHCSIGQRLLTSETGCGHGSGQRIFKGRRGRTGRHTNGGALPGPRASRRLDRLQARAETPVNKRRQLLTGPSPTSPSSSRSSLTRPMARWCWFGNTRFCKAHGNPCSVGQMM